MVQDNLEKTVYVILNSHYDRGDMPLLTQGQLTNIRPDGKIDHYLRYLPPDGHSLVFGQNVPSITVPGEGPISGGMLSTLKNMLGKYLLEYNSPYVVITNSKGCDAVKSAISGTNAKIELVN